MLVSIIIPVYNVEQYIEQCLSSIYAQDISEDIFEVIAVNDGTPDNSMSIVKTIASQHKNLVIINQENQGLSVARNTGLDHAKGEYIWFVDSDDWLTKDSLSIVLDTIISYPKIDVFATVLMMQYEKTIRQKLNMYQIRKLKADAIICFAITMPTEVLVSDMSSRRLFLKSMT